MFLIRCNHFLYRKNGNLLNLFKQSTVYYSDEKCSSDDKINDSKSKGEKKRKSVEKSTKQERDSAPKSLSPESQNRLNELLKKLSSRSALNIVKDVQITKPLGYRHIVEMQKFNATESKPRNVRDAAKAVSRELGDKKIESDILSPYAPDKEGEDFLEYA